MNKQTNMTATENANLRTATGVSTTTILYTSICDS